MPIDDRYRVAERFFFGLTPNISMIATAARTGGISVSSSADYAFRAARINFSSSGVAANV
jgi:hypothetical protein